MADWESKKIHDVVQDINDHTVVLPVIQRNLVWDEEKMELLFDSLLKGNSFGGIMALEDERGSEPLFAFRHFSRDGEIHDSVLPTVLDRNTLLIIDGQQRLQTFYMGLMGGVNSKELYFNLFSQGDYEFEFAHQVSDLPSIRRENGLEIQTLWYPVTQLYTRLARTNDDMVVAREIINVRDIQDEKYRDLVRTNVRSFERVIFAHKAIGLSKVYINKEDFEAERRRMVELFRRLNDGGTRLSALDLAASSLKGFDYRLEGFLRRDITQYGDIGFGADEVVKLLFLLQDNYTKEVTDIGKDDAEFAVKNKERILKTLDVLRQLLMDADLYEFYRDGGRSVIPLYFVVYHIFHKQIPDEALMGFYENYDANNRDFTNIKRWLYLSLLNGVFSRGKGWIPYRTGIHKILNVVTQYKNSLFPADQIFSMYETHPLVFSREITPKQLSQWDMNFLFYLVYGCRSLSGRDIDHIQPKSLLGDQHIPADKIHSISNYQLLDVDTNRASKRAKELKEWLKDWEEAERNQYLQRHLIPPDPDLWSLDNFDEFLNQRSKMIIEKIQQYIPARSTLAQPATQPASEPASKDFSEVKGAAQLTNAERDPAAWLTAEADKRGYGKEFRQVVEGARSVGLYARFQNNWWIVMFTPPKNRNHWLIELSTSLDIWVNAERIAKYLNCPAELVKEKLDFGSRLKVEDVPLWNENLRSLFAQKMDVKTNEDDSNQAIATNQLPYPAQSVISGDILETLKNNLPPELNSHPILSDKSTWDDYFIQNKLGGPQWSRRISRELDLAGIYTVADMGLLVMVLGLRVSHKNSWGNFYVFNRTLPSGQKPMLRTKHFGPWSWKMVLGRLKTGGFNWEEYLSD